MTQLNDVILEALLLNGAVTPHITDAWYEFLISKGIPPSHRNSMELVFWESGGIIDAVITPPTPPTGSGRGDGFGSGFG